MKISNALIKTIKVSVISGALDNSLVTIGDVSANMGLAKVELRRATAGTVGTTALRLGMYKIGTDSVSAGTADADLGTFSISDQTIQHGFGTIDKQLKDLIDENSRVIEGQEVDLRLALTGAATANFDVELVLTFEDRM